MYIDFTSEETKLINDLMTDAGWVGEGIREWVFSGDSSVRAEVIKSAPKEYDDLIIWGVRIKSSDGDLHPWQYFAAMSGEAGMIIRQLVLFVTSNTKGGGSLSEPFVTHFIGSLVEYGHNTLATSRASKVLMSGGHWQRE